MVLLLMQTCYASTHMWILGQHIGSTCCCLVVIYFQVELFLNVTERDELYLTLEGVCLHRSNGNCNAKVNGAIAM